MSHSERHGNMAMGCLRRRLAYFPSSPRPQDTRIRQGTEGSLLHPVCGVCMLFSLQPPGGTQSQTRCTESGVCACFFPLLLSPSQAQSLLQTQLQVYDTPEMGFWGEVSECKNWKLTWNLFLWARDSKIRRFRIIFLTGRTDTLLLLPRTKQVLIAQVGTRTPTWSTHSRRFLLGLWSHLSVDFLFCVCGLQGRGGQWAKPSSPIWPLGQASNPFLSNWIDSESRDLHFAPSFAAHQLHDLDLSSLGLEPKCAWASP